MRNQATAMTILCLFTLAAVAVPTAPFNSKNSSQVFQKSQSGGIQQLVANDPNDKQLITQIRTFLEVEAERVGGGDYAGAIRIEGKEVPVAPYFKGIKPGQIAIIYRNVPAGGAIDYVGKDAATVTAIHGWFDALLSDDE